jgi:hypothetical protein
VRTGTLLAALPLLEDEEAGSLGVAWIHQGISAKGTSPGAQPASQA